MSRPSWRKAELQDAIIDAVRTMDGVGGIKAFDAYEDYIEAEARADVLDVVRRYIEFDDAQPDVKPDDMTTEAWDAAVAEWHRRRDALDAILAERQP